MLPESISQALLELWQVWCQNFPGEHVALHNLRLGGEPNQEA